MGQWLGDAVLFRHLRKLGSWFFLSKTLTIACSVWVTRLLRPEDFSIIASVLAIQGIVIMVAGVNFYSNLVRADTVSDEELEVAWSCDLVRNLILAIGLFSSAPHVARVVDLPEAALVFQVSSLQLVLVGLRNPRLLELRRNGKFGVLGAQESIGPVAYAVSSVVLAMFRPDYWALVGAGLLSFVASSVGSYVRLPWRPRISFNWDLARPMINFGLVVQAGAILSTMRQHSLTLLLILFSLSEEVGYLNRAVTFSMAISLQFVSLFWKVSYPHYAKIENGGGCSMSSAKELQRKIVFMGVPLSVFIAITGWYLIPIILGPEWRPIRPIWSILIVASVFIAANTVVDSALQASRREHLCLRLQAIGTACQLVFSFLFIAVLGLNGAGGGVLVATLVVLGLQQKFCEPSNLGEPKAS